MLAQRQDMYHRLVRAGPGADTVRTPEPVLPFLIGADTRVAVRTERRAQ